LKVDLKWAPFALERLRKAGSEPAPPKRPAHRLWAALIARIYEVFLLLGPICGGQMRTIAFISYSADIRKILAYSGVQRRRDRAAAHHVSSRATAVGGAKFAQRHQPLRPISASAGEGLNSEMVVAGRQAAPGTAQEGEGRQTSGE
jgi:hypothetical protein